MTNWEISQMVVITILLIATLIITKKEKTPQS